MLTPCTGIKGHSSKLLHDIGEKHGSLRFWHESMLLDERDSALDPSNGRWPFTSRRCCSKARSPDLGKDWSKVGSGDRQFLNKSGEKHRSFILWPRSALFNEGSTAHLVPRAGGDLLLVDICSSKAQTLHQLPESTILVERSRICPLSIWACCCLLKLANSEEIEQK